MKEKVHTYGKCVVIVTAAVFVLLGILYFAPVELPHKIILPVSLLACACFAMRYRLAAAAFLLSAAGDFMGSLHFFLPQLSFFALSHIMFVMCFVRMLRRPVCRSAAMKVGVILPAAILLAVAVVKIIAGIPDISLKIATLLYALIILTMFLCAVMTRRRTLATGAALFVLSDFVLAWNRFTSPIENAGMIIMVSYYSAQLLLFIGLCGGVSAGGGNAGMKENENSRT